MKKALVLVTELNNNKSTFIKLLRNHIGNKVQVDVDVFDNLIFETGESGTKITISGKNILDFDFVFFRGVRDKMTWVAGCVALFLEKHNKSYIDTIYKKIGPRTVKFPQLVELSLNGLLIPQTIFFLDPNRDKHFRLISQKLGLPFVAKDIFLQRGRGVYLINNRQDFDKLSGKEDKNTYLFQKFIERESEYRMLILGNDVGIWYEKLPQPGEFRGNTALGATEKYLDRKNTPSKMSKIGKKAAKLLGLQVAGVDIMTKKGSDRIYLLEVNRGPGLTYDESLSPEVKAVSEYILRETTKKRWPRLH